MNVAIVRASYVVFVTCALAATALSALGCDPFAASHDQPEFFESDPNGELVEPRVEIPPATTEAADDIAQVLSQRPERDWAEPAAMGKDTIGIGKLTDALALPFIEDFDCAAGSAWTFESFGPGSMQYDADDAGCFLKASAAPRHNGPVVAVASSPVIDVADASRLRLEFDERGGCNGMTGFCDFRVEVHSEVDGDWTVVSSHRIHSTVDAFDWRRVDVDLSGVTGDFIQVRLVLEAQASTYGFADWRIDDLSLRGTYQP